MSLAELDQHEARQRTRKRVIVGALVIVAMAAIAYSRAPGLGFIWDDESYVQNNQLLHTLDGLGRMWIPRETPQYYPVVFTTFWIEHQLWDLDPAGYHVVNVILHILNALLLWLLCTRIGLPGAASWLIAAIFAVHPVHVESVAWITERKNVLSGLFYLSAAIAYFNFQSIRDAEIAEKTAKDARGWYGVALVLFVLALLSKSVTCSLPAAIILIFLWQRKPLTPARLLPLAPMFLLGLLAALNTSIIEREHVGAEGIAFDLGFAERLLIASRALLFYPLKIVWPHPLIFNYERWHIDTGNVVSWWPVLVVALIFIGLIWLFVRGSRGPFIAFSFFAGTVFPAIGFFNVYPHQFSFVADHFQYLASIGLIALPVMAGCTLARDPRRLIAIGAAPLLIFTGLTWAHTDDFRDLETLWRSTLAKNPDAWLAHSNLSSVLLRQTAARIQAGADASDLIEQAEYHARRSISINPDRAAAHSNLSEALRLQERYEEALEQITIATNLRPEWPDHHFYRGRLLELTDRRPEAVEEYRRTLELAPAHRIARLELARALLALNEIDAAAEEYAAQLERDPENFTALGSLAAIRARQGRARDAESLYERAIAAAQRPQDYVQVAMRFAIFLMQCPDDAVRNPDKAVIVAEQVIRATNGSLPNTLDVLAMAYAAAGRFEDATRTAEAAVDLARRLGLEEMASQYEAHLRQIRDHQVPPEGRPQTN